MINIFLASKLDGDALVVKRKKGKKGKRVYGIEKVDEIKDIVLEKLIEEIRLAREVVEAENISISSLSNNG